MRIAMIGSGYVGLVSGACFAKFGIDVTCVDNDKDKIQRLNNGEIPIYEPGLDNLVESCVKSGSLHFTTDLAATVAQSDAVFIAVGTPSRRGDGHADLSYVYAAAAEIARSIDGYTVIITKSTVPVGTCSEVEAVVRDTRADADFDVVSNPEFLREGSAIEDFMRPDRVVIGTEIERAKDVMRALYRPLFLSDTPILFTERRTAELIKYATNAFLATKITFINEMADICDKLGANVQDVAKGIGLDGRIGAKFLHAGPGYGGSCFPKDTLALVRTAQDAGAPTQIVESVVRANKARKLAMAQRVIEACGGSVSGRTIALLGVTFKPNTDDMRESPSLDIVPALQAAGATVRAYDPEGMNEAKALLPGVEWAEDSYAAMTDANALVLLTEWDEFRMLDFGEVKSRLKNPIMIDLRNIYDPEEMLRANFEYHSIGRPALSGVSNKAESIGVT
ncbi:MAG: UDP-glucose dehydrogenase family protein [Alphaproteobacteria bacterium]|jgi:UDPglucose 6-dehydrogenase